MSIDFYITKTLEDGKKISAKVPDGFEDFEVLEVEEEYLTITDGNRVATVKRES